MASKKSEKKATKNVKKTVSTNLESVTESTTKAEPTTDRVIRAGRSLKNAACPECHDFPTITKIRRGSYELRRCRECGHCFEINGVD